MYSRRNNDLLSGGIRDTQRAYSIRDMLKKGKGSLSTLLQFSVLFFHRRQVCKFSLQTNNPKFWDPSRQFMKLVSLSLV